MSIELISSPQPHFIPGYTGFCPQYKYRVGNTYGSTTHKLLLDPTVNHAEHLVLSDRSVDDYQVDRPSQNDIDIVQARTKYGDAVYKHPMTPGYDGFVPRLNGLLGQCYNIGATEAISTFEQQQLTNKEVLNQLTKQVNIQNSQWEPRNIEERMMAESQFKLPLLEVRPECAGIMRNIPVEEPPIAPPRAQAGPFFMDNDNPDKVLKQGFAGHIPFGYDEFGKSYDAMSKSALCNFTSNYRQRQSTEWAPVTISRPDPPLVMNPAELYHKHIGMLPNYCGHIPGAIFRNGKTFGNDTRDCKRWLRADYNS